MDEKKNRNGNESGQPVRAAPFHGKKKYTARLYRKKSKDLSGLGKRVTDSVVQKQVVQNEEQETKAENVLKDVPYEKKEDLALTYHILVEQEAGGISSAMITNSIMKIYGIDQEQLHKDAIENSPKILPAKVMSVGSMLLNSLEKDGEDVDVNIRSALEGESSSMLTIVTNEVT